MTRITCMNEGTQETELLESRSYHTYKDLFTKAEALNNILEILEWNETHDNRILPYEEAVFTTWARDAYEYIAAVRNYVRGVDDTAIEEVCYTFMRELRNVEDYFLTLVEKRRT